MAHSDKDSQAGFNITANEMLRRLNNQYKADKFADRYTYNSEYVKADDGSIQIDISTLSDEEFKALFDSYLSTSNMNVNMTEATYKSLRYHIINLQKNSGAMLVTEDEMEKRFADAENAAREVDVFEDTAEDTTVVSVPEGEDDGEDFDEDFGATTEFINPERVFVQPDPEKEKANEAEQLKKRRMSLFAKLKALMHDEEAPAEDTFTQEQQNAFQSTDMIAIEDDTPDEFSDDEATEEFTNFMLREKAAEQDAQEEEACDEQPEETEAQEETGAEEENTEQTPAYPDEEEEEDLPVYSEEETEEETEEDEEVPGEIDPEKPDDEFLTAEEEREEEGEEEAYDEPETPEEEYEQAEEENTEDGEEAYEEEGTDGEDEGETPVYDDGEEEGTDEVEDIIDAFCADPIEDHEDLPKHIFDESSYETEELDYPEDTAAEEDEESDGYVSFEQNGEILEAYKRKYKSVRARMCISAAIAAFLLVLENIGIFGIILPEFMRSGAFLVPLEWTCIFGLAFLVCDSLAMAAKKLVKLEFEPGTVTLAAFALAVCTTFAGLFVQGDLKLFNFTFALCVFFHLVSLFIGMRKEIYTFKIISAPKRKHAVTLVSGNDATPETEEFIDYLSEKSEIYRVEETDFVDGYFNKKKKAPAMNKKLRVLVPACFGVSLLVALLSALIMRTDAYSTLANGYLTFIMCAPVAVFLANELPMYFSSISAYSNNSAILGDVAPEMMENMSVVSFSDSDVFKDGGVRIKGVKIIDNNRIDHIIYYASSVFNLVGGPLSKVFRQASLDSAEPESAEIRVVSSKGIDAMVDGKHIVVGVHQFMDAQCFRPVREAGDDQWEGKTNKRILYLACDEELIAKFYVEYNVNPEFVYLVKKLSAAGICVGVRTNDPCMDADIFYKNKLSPEQYPIRVVKGVEEGENKHNVSAKKSGLVAAGSIKGLVKTLLLCDRLTNVTSTNFVMKAVAAVIGLLIMCFVIFGGILLANVWSVYFALYQLLWLIPIYVISKIYI